MGKVMPRVVIVSWTVVPMWYVKGGVGQGGYSREEFVERLRAKVFVAGSAERERTGEERYAF